MAQRFQLTLSAEELDALTDILHTSTPMKKRRAQIILMTADEIPQVDIAAKVGLSERQVRRWQRSFQRQRMGIFLRHSIGAPSTTDEAEESGVEEHAAAPAAQPEPEPVPVALPGIDAPRRQLALASNAGLAPDDSMSEAGRKVLLYHFERMLFNEPGSRLGKDIEAVHDMRVATRRMRSAFAIFAPFYKEKVVKPYLRDLRRVAQALGEVRDLDVFIEKLSLYQEAQANNTEDSLAPLLEVCEAQRVSARERLVAHLDSPKFAGFVEDFGTFLVTSNAGAIKPKKNSPDAYQVRHVVPRLIYTRYEAVRAYETVLEHASIDTLHALRIECKRLRYALEFFQEVQGPEAQVVIKEIKRLQDHLGDLNDAEVAGVFLRDFVTRYEDSQAGIPISERRSIEQVVQYMAHQFAEKHRLTMTFADTWANFNRYDIRRDLALAVAAL